MRERITATDDALAGWRVLVPRPAGHSSTLVRLLDRYGAVAQAIPMIEISPASDPAALDSAVLALSVGEFSWIGFTSVNAVSAITDRAAALELSAIVPADTRVAAVGPATAEAIRRAGLAVDLVPVDAGSAVALADSWPAAHPGESVLLPQSEIASPVLAAGLRAKGFDVHVVAAYRTVPATLPESVASDLGNGAFDAVLFTSPSTVAAVAGVPVHSAVVIGAIGATTAAAVQASGMTIGFVADEPTDSALAAGLAAAALSRKRTR